ncbi:nitronate monooxygenase [soil metagenome]
MLGIEAMRREIDAIRQASSGGWNVNFFCHADPSPDAERERRWRDALAPWYAEFGLTPDPSATGPARRPFSHEIADALEDLRPPVVSFHFGLPAPDLLARVRSWGSLILSSATTVAEARWLEAHGADAVIAQGLEAGGHRGMFLTDDVTTQLGLFALLPQVVAAVRVPVIAAGGIVDGRTAAAALALGASAVQAGTVYLTCPEADTSAVHRDALASETAAHTALTNLFSGRPARGIVNRLMRELGPLSALPPAFPLATAAIAPLRAAAEKRGSGDFSPLWCGQNASRCRPVAAADVTHELTSELS